MHHPPTHPPTHPPIHPSGKAELAIMELLKLLNTGHAKHWFFGGSKANIASCILVLVALTLCSGCNFGLGSERHEPPISISVTTPSELRFVVKSIGANLRRMRYRVKDINIVFITDTGRVTVGADKIRVVDDSFGQITIVCDIPVLTPGDVTYEISYVFDSSENTSTYGPVKVVED